MALERRLPVAEAAARLGIAASTVRDWIHAGRIRAVLLRPGAQRPTYRVPESECERVEAERAARRSTRP